MVLGIFEFAKGGGGSEAHFWSFYCVNFKNLNFEPIDSHMQAAVNVKKKIELEKNI